MDKKFNRVDIMILNALFNRETLLLEPVVPSFEIWKSLSMILSFANNGKPTVRMDAMITSNVMGQH
jgi:hypothetical protein